MVEPYYNTTYGTGIEGVGNYVNELTGQLFAPVFLFSMWIIMFFVLGKSEWKMSANFTFTSFMVLLMTWIMGLFITISPRFMFTLSLMLGIGIVWSMFESNKR